MRWLLVPFMAAACASSSATTPPPNEAPTDEPAPEEGDVRDAMREEGLTACTTACRHIASCEGARADDCRGHCDDDLAGDSGAPTLRYAGCVESLTCDEFDEGDPLSGCLTQALRMAR